MRNLQVDDENFIFGARSCKFWAPRHIFSKSFRIILKYQKLSKSCFSVKNHGLARISNLLDIRNFYGLRAKNCKFRIFWKVFSILKFHSKFSLKKSQFPTESFENTFGELSVACPSLLCPSLLGFVLPIMTSLTFL